MNKLAQFFQDDNGNFSSTRLAFLAMFAALIAWGVDSWNHDRKMANVPESVWTVIAVLMTGKVTQKFGEKPDIQSSSESVDVVGVNPQQPIHTTDNSGQAGVLLGQKDS